jgi:S-adenosylmethionine hydrolase
MTRPIFFLTDFGLADTYVGIVKAVILGIAPEARIVDLSHDVPPQDVRAGAFALFTAAPYLPDDAVVLAVVDPGVGTARRPIVVQSGGRALVGPDNGLLSWAVGEALTPQPPLPAAGEGERSGGAAPAIATVYVLDRPRFWLPSVSATFHGRDLFGPVAAHLARGVRLTELGSPAGEIERLPFPSARRDVGADGRVATVHGEVIHVDRFGNLISSLWGEDLPPEPVVEIAGRAILGLAPHFQPGSGDLIALIGSAGLLEIAVPNGSAEDALGVGVGAAVRVVQKR